MKKTKTFRKEAVVWLITTLLVLTAVVVFTPFAIITRAAPLPFSTDFESASNWASKWAQDIVSDGAPSDPDTHFWQRVDSTYSATPTNLDPYSGNYMAIFDSGLLYPHGTQTRLFLTDSLDFTSSSSGNVYLSFYLYYSDWGSTEDDDLVVEVNVGSGWILVDTYDTYDPSDLGWVQETVDLSSYNTASEAYIGFLAVDDGYRDVCIDNVVVGESPPPPSC